MQCTTQYLRTLIMVIWIGCTASNVTYAGESPDHVRSAGCGIIQIGAGNFIAEEIRVLDLNRSYHLYVPNKYDPHRAYPLIFRWHGFGGDGLSGGLGIEQMVGNEAIIVSADGLNKSWKFNGDPADLQFFDRMLDTIEKKYCIDRDRVFSYGFSVGGAFANLLACERGDVLRGSAAIESGPRAGTAIALGSNCKGKVASWFLHDLDDHIVPIEGGRAARDRAITLNGCSADTVNEGNSCVRYQGCKKSPVVWCESKWFGHNIRGDFAPALVWDFFRKLR